MKNEIQVVAYEGGELRFASAIPPKSGEAVLALPLTRLLAKMVRVPAGEEPEAVALPILKAMSPFPDDPLAVSCETVREEADGARIVLAAALPESAADDIAELLDARKLSVIRVDAIVLGALRAIWDRFETSDGRRRLLKLRSADCLTLFVLDGDQPVSLRAIADDTELERETLLSLLEAEDFGGPKELAETLEFEIPPEALTGVAVRSLEPDTIDALPDSWREVLAETRFKAKLVRNLVIAGAIWALVMAVLFGVPWGYGFRTDYMKKLCKEHSKQYRQVSDKKAKVRLVRKYSDHRSGALETMRNVSDRMPEGITLSRWDYKRGEYLRMKGVSEGNGPAYQFKDALETMKFDEDDADRTFKTVSLGALTQHGNKGEQNFDVECRYEEEGE